MLRFPFLAAIALLFAEIIEMGILPPLRDALPTAIALFFTWQLLALCALTAGLLRGELSGMITAIFAAMLLGFSTDPNALGPAILAFGIGAVLAGRLTRYLRLIRFHNRFFTFFLLLSTTSLLFVLIQKLFWSNTRIDLPWLGIMMTSIIGAIVFAALAPRFRLDLIDED